MDHLVLDNLAKSFGLVHAVRGVSLRIGRGESVTLLGPSGCGKTTTLQMIAGFQAPDLGTITLDGRDLTAVPAYARQTPLVFQDYALFPHLNVFDNVAYGLRVRGRRRTGLRQKVDATLEQLGLLTARDRLPSQLSGGQQQRVALARALVLDPEVLLLDEPLSNLDAKLRVKVRHEIRQLQTRLKITMVYVTHDQEEALAISDRIAVMNEGAVDQFATPREVYCRPQTRFVARFIGEANLAPVRVLAVRPAADGVCVRIDLYGSRHEVTGDYPDLAAGQDRLLLLRPETLAVAPQGEVGNGEARLSGIVREHSFLGPVTRYWVEVAGSLLVVDDPGTAERGLLEGEVCLALKPRSLHFLPA
jgi:ABC-type Fe3+/spermidine/putrescine transport system ATPase subunit